MLAFIERESSLAEERFSPGRASKKGMVHAKQTPEKMIILVMLPAAKTVMTNGNT